MPNVSLAYQVTPYGSMQPAIAQAKMPMPPNEAIHPRIPKLHTEMVPQAQVKHVHGIEAVTQEGAGQPTVLVLM